MDGQTQSSGRYFRRRQFLDLPAELRLLVYHRLFPLSDIVPRNFETNDWTKFPRHSIKLAILETCRVVYSEAHDIAFRHAAFHLFSNRMIENDSLETAALARSAIANRLLRCDARLRYLIRRLTLLPAQIQLFIPLEVQRANYILRPLVPFDSTSQSSKAIPLPELPNLEVLLLTKTRYSNDAVELALSLSDTYPMLKTLAYVSPVTRACGRNSCMGYGGCKDSLALHGGDSETVQERARRWRLEFFTYLKTQVGFLYANNLLLYQKRHTSVTFILEYCGRTLFNIRQTSPFNEETKSTTIIYKREDECEGYETKWSTKNPKILHLILGTADEVRERMNQLEISDLH